jgi:hypothetical protein
MPEPQKEIPEPRLWRSPMRVEIENSYPLSRIQHGMLFHSLYGGLLIRALEYTNERNLNMDGFCIKRGRVSGFRLPISDVMCRGIRDAQGSWCGYTPTVHRNKLFSSRSSLGVPTRGGDGSTGHNVEAQHSRNAEVMRWFLRLENFSRS